MCRGKTKTKTKITQYIADTCLKSEPRCFRQCGWRCMGGDVSTHCVFRTKAVVKPSHVLQHGRALPETLSLTNHSIKLTCGHQAPRNLFLLPSFFIAPQFSYVIRRLRSHGSETMRDDFGNSLRITEIKFEGYHQGQLGSTRRSRVRLDITDSRQAAKL